MNDYRGKGSKQAYNLNTVTGFKSTNLALAQEGKAYKKSNIGLTADAMKKKEQYLQKACQGGLEEGAQGKKIRTATVITSLNDSLKQVTKYHKPLRIDQNQPQQSIRGTAYLGANSDNSLSVNTPVLNPSRYTAAATSNQNSKPPEKTETIKIQEGRMNDSISIIESSSKAQPNKAAAQLQRQTTYQPETLKTGLSPVLPITNKARLNASQTSAVHHKEITTDTLEILIRTNVQKMVTICSKVKGQKDEDSQFLTESKLKKYQLKNRTMSSGNMMQFNFGDESESLRKEEFFDSKRPQSRVNRIEVVQRPNMAVLQMETKIMQQKKDQETFMINTGDDDSDLFTGGNDDFVNTNLNFQQEQKRQNSSQPQQMASSPNPGQNNVPSTPKPAESKNIFGKIFSFIRGKK